MRPCEYSKGPGKGTGCEDMAVRGERFCQPHLDHINASRENPRGGAVGPRGGTDTPAGGAETPRGGATEPRGGLTHPRGGAVEPPDA